MVLDFQPFFVFCIGCMDVLIVTPRLYAPEENVISTCWIEGLYLTKKWTHKPNVFIFILL